MLVKWQEPEQEAMFWSEKKLYGNIIVKLVLIDLDEKMTLAS